MNKKCSFFSFFSFSPASLLHILLVLGMLFTPSANRAMAQAPNPPAPTPVPPPASYGVVPQEQQVAESQPEAPAAEETVSIAPESQPAALTFKPSAMQINEPNAPQVQGVVLLDVAVPDTTSAGETVTYTYRYSNTSALPVNNIVLDASWSNFTGASSQQKCYDTGCPAILVQGPAVITTTPPSTANMRYLIGTLAGNQSGQFSVIMRVDSADYPKTGQAIARPAGSGKLYRDNNTATLISDDTANTMIVGPVLVLTKTASSTIPIYTGETAEFNIRLGNASAAGDSVGGSVRADARLATNVVLRDTYPKGSVFVSATGPYVKDDISRIVTWTFPSLAVVAYQDLKVVFRKVDSPDDCTTLDNDTYEATSDEYPLQSPSKRYTVKGAIASVPVVPPLQVPFITPTVSSLYYGNDTIITITVRNHFTAALTGVEMKYVLPENLGYVEPITGSVLISTPNTSLGGEVGWRFNLPAATTKTIPAIKVFSIRVRAAFFSSTQKGVASVVNSGSISLPLTCAAKVGGPDVKPRVKIEKLTTEPDRYSPLDNVYLARRGEAFPFVITLTNRSIVDVVGLVITDSLPGKNGEPDANMTYVQNSGMLNGVPRDPDVVINGYAGKLIWRNLTVPANSVVVLRYDLTIQGRDYYKYCNTVTGGLGDESFEYGSKGICVKINPYFELEKIPDRFVAGPGEEVTFTLRVTNHELIPYTFGLFDRLNKFAFVRQISGYADPITVTAPTAGLEWPLVTLTTGQSLESQIVVRMPDEGCADTKYDNEIMFNFVSEGAKYLVREIPPHIVSIQCAAIEFRKTADRSTVSLRDLMTFTLSLKNINPSDAVTNVNAIDLLPPGFSYVAMSPFSDLSITPTQATGFDGRTQLTWNLGTIAGGQTRNLRFFARTSDTVGSFENWVTQASPVSGRCLTACKIVLENSLLKKYYFIPVTVAPLNTIAPQVRETTCARPGDTRTYRLTMVNTNVHSYEQITTTVALPLGLRFSRIISGTSAPQVIEAADGTQTVRWVNQRIAAKPNGVFAAQVEYWMELSVGNVLGDLQTVATASSPDGLIPRKDDVSDPSVPMCAPAAPAMVKAVNRPQAAAGSEVVYQITLANPTGSPINTTVGDPLPGSFSYVAMVSGPEPTVNGGNLTWNNVSIPAAVNSPGLSKLIFRAIASGTADQTYTNTAVNTGGIDASLAVAPLRLNPPVADLVGTLFNDLDSNGVLDSGETGIANAPVTLTLSSGTLVTQTNSQGAYGFYAVSVGSYIVEVGPRANVINTSPQSVAGTLTPGTTTTVNFGYGTVPLLSINDVSVNEGNTGTTALVFNISLSKASGLPITVNYATANVSAVAPTDYTAISGTATIAPGATSTQVIVLVNGDTQTEPNETLVVNLSAPTNATLLDGQGKGTLVNDDGTTPPPIVYVSIDDATPLNEGNSGARTAVFRVWLTTAASQPVTVSFKTADFFALAGSDYVAQEGQLVIPAGSTEGFVNVSVNGDTTYEADETFYVNLVSASNATLSASSQGKGSILNDDLPVFTVPTINISDASLQEGHTNAGQRMRFTVVLTSSTANTVTVQYKTVSTGSATPGTDYEEVDSTTSTPLTFAPGQTIAFVYVQIFGDTAREPGETFNVTLSAPAGGALGRATATGTILDDDGPRVFLPFIRKSQ